MKNDEHTPGPWKIAQRRFFEDTPQRDWPAGGILADYSDNFEVISASDGEVRFHAGKADARLVATAPELLAALRDLVARAEEAGWHRSEMQEARGIIAKATGAESERSNGCKLSDGSGRCARGKRNRRRSARDVRCSAGLGSAG